AQCFQQNDQRGHHVRCVEEVFHRYCVADFRECVGESQMEERSSKQCGRTDGKALLMSERQKKSNVSKNQSDQQRQQTLKDVLQRITLNIDFNVNQRKI